MIVGGLFVFVGVFEGGRITVGQSTVSWERFESQPALKLLTSPEVADNFAT